MDELTTGHINVDRSCKTIEIKVWSGEVARVSDAGQTEERSCICTSDRVCYIAEIYMSACQIGFLRATKKKERQAKRPNKNQLASPTDNAIV